MFIEYLDTMDDVYNNIDDYNPTSKGKVLIVFDDMLAELWLIQNFRPQLKNYLLDTGN